eukprot:TRINITY_DN66486_c5_g1_i1.p2 TRINITY_DN66486_c5_g1~~TRINITY_DN66486_c5_g1_i1.p2  ORF type:complete len:197 (+),score=43.23 TRINITY_DN66486_c5_g1_i1:232-822(+)
MIEEYCKRNKVHGLVVCSKDYSRVKIGAQMVVRLMDMMFPDQKKWDGMVFCWTHGDKAEQDDVDNLKNVVDHLNKTVDGNITQWCTVSNHPKDNTPDVNDFLVLLKQIASGYGVGEFQPPSSEEMASMVNKVMGDKFGDTEKLTKEIEELRKQVASKPPFWERVAEKWLGVIPSVVDNLSRGLAPAVGLALARKIG